MELTNQTYLRSRGYAIGRQPAHESEQQDIGRGTRECPRKCGRFFSRYPFQIQPIPSSVTASKYSELSFLPRGSKKLDHEARDVMEKIALY